MAARSRRRATLEDILGRDDLDRLEIIDGAIVEKTSPTGEHAAGQALSAMAGETVRAEPFDAIELRVSVLFGDEEDEE